MTNRYSDTKWDYSFPARPTPDSYVDLGFKKVVIVDPKIQRKDQQNKLIPHVTKTRHKGKNFVKTKSLDRLGLINDSRQSNVSEAFLKACLTKVIRDTDKTTRDLVKNFIKTGILLDTEVVKLGKLFKISDFAQPNLDEQQIMSEYNLSLADFKSEQIQNVKNVLVSWRRREILYV